MAMIYNLVTAAQEWLAARTAAGPGGGGLDPEAEEKRRREEEEAARAAARAHGTPVTSESFTAWRQQYEAEVALQKAQLAEGSKDDKAGRLTGESIGRLNCNNSTCKNTVMVVLTAGHRTNFVMFCIICRNGLTQKPEGRVEPC
jgi:hypothetical protein